MGIESLTSLTAYTAMLNEHWELYPEDKQNFDEDYADYDWVDGIPKSKFFVKLNPEISSDQQNAVINGLRNNLDARVVFLLTKSDVESLISSFSILR